MRIPCPHCGERGNEEFTYLGDATVSPAHAHRPRAEVPHRAWMDYVYLRDNPAGVHRELWQHVPWLPLLAGGDAKHATHEILGVERARDGARPTKSSAAMIGHGLSCSRTARAGGLVDRATVPHFSFDGRNYSGHPGDTLASALIANGVKLVGRSFKYHRPRGLLSAGPEEPNALVEIGTRRPARTQHPRHRGRALRWAGRTSQNRWPSLALRPDERQPACRPVPSRRVLLQDVHVAGLASGRSCTSP